MVRFPRLQLSSSGTAQQQLCSPHLVVLVMNGGGTHDMLADIRNPYQQLPQDDIGLLLSHLAFHLLATNQM
jgi:hypothetical protein